jgi:hypothetical protein
VSEKTMPTTKEDPSLIEVKAILSKLQRLDLKSNEGLDGTSAAPTGGVERKAGPSRTVASAETGRLITPVKAETGYEWKGRIPIFLSGMGVLICATVVLFATGHVSMPRVSKTDSAKTAPASDEKGRAVLAKALLSLSEGNVIVTRTQLLNAGPERSAEVAFMLAQSYDPNYLRSLPKTDCPPDPAEAERWYKKWYELAIQSGLEMDSARLRRIINAMR